jgi:putative DNA primase/helicase
MILRPTALIVDPNGIPESARREPRWCLWRYAFVGGDWKKPPFRLDDPQTEAGVNDPLGFGAFDDALRIYQNGGFDGVGFRLGDGWAGIDLDGCRDAATGELSAFASGVLRELNSYAEVSPSGTGLKIFVRAWPGKNHSRKGLEVYGHGRYFTVTGAHV